MGPRAEDTGPVATGSVGTRPDARDRLLPDALTPSTHGSEAWAKNPQLEVNLMAAIKKRHSENCPARRGKRCSCNGGYRAEVYSPRDKKKLRKTFSHRADAQSWAAEVKRGVDHGTLRAPTKRTLGEVAATWLAGVEDGTIRNRSGNRYKPATLRGYRQALQDHVLPALGGRKMNAVTTSDLQALVDRWGAEDQSPSTIRNSIKPLQAIYRRARAREGLAVNPTRDLELPAPSPKEVEIVAPEVAAQLLDVLPVEDRALWATALYAGLRYGELRALRWSAVDRAIRVTESWDPKEGAIAPKTKNSQRTTPLPGLLRDYLMERSRLPDGASDCIWRASRRRSCLRRYER